jgi:hypothetical protein
MKNKKFEVLPINIDKIKEESNLYAIKKPSSETSIKMMLEINSELAEKLKDYAYWLRTTQGDVLLEAFAQFTKNNPVETRPESEKKKRKVGRKRKSEIIR